MEFEIRKHIFFNKEKFEKEVEEILKMKVVIFNYKPKYFRVFKSPETKSYMTIHYYPDEIGNIEALNEQLNEVETTLKELLIDDLYFVKALFIEPEFEREIRIDRLVSVCITLEIDGYIDDYE